MPDPDAVRRLLSGEINPEEIESDSGLYSMAERIYGSEVLEEMGVLAPEISTVELHPDTTPITSDISLPDFQPIIPLNKASDSSIRGRPRYLLILIGLFGSIFVLYNMAFGLGSVLCSTGVADMKEICNDEYGQTKLVFTEGYSWDAIHQIEAWVEPMDSPLLGDIIFLGLCISMILIGLIWRKRLVHPSQELPLSG
ncbi:MAG: hypothetical protein CMA12_02835 [Euryarchaeota archaeon]|nr:hypothetical protein [Euryarchaeota archaeon]OUW22628.1 MAG: hypothetical protein CBD33_01405 [Euryarchaeota archaeon TMED173]